MVMRRLALVAIVVPLALPIPSFAQCVDINTASVQELRQIIHIDEKRGSEIVRLRQERPFRSDDQLTPVKSIADARIQDIKAQRLGCVR